MMIYCFSDEITVHQLVRTYGLQVSTIMIPATDSSHSQFYDELSTRSGGFSFLIRQSPHPMDTYTSLLESFMIILQQDLSNPLQTYLVHKNEHFTVDSAGLNSSSVITRGSFSLDAWLGRDTSFGIFVADTEDHLIK